MPSKIPFNYRGSKLKEKSRLELYLKNSYIIEPFFWFRDNIWIFF